MQHYFQMLTENRARFGAGPDAGGKAGARPSRSPLGLPAVVLFKCRFRWCSSSLTRCTHDAQLVAPNGRGALQRGPSSGGSPCAGAGLYLRGSVAGLPSRDRDGPGSAPARCRRPRARGRRVRARRGGVPAPRSPGGPLRSFLRRRTGPGPRSPCGSSVFRSLARLRPRSLTSA